MKITKANGKIEYQLIETLKILQSKYQLICVTNNPVLPARKTLEAIGISDFFPEPHASPPTCHEASSH